MQIELVEEATLLEVPEFFLNVLSEPLKIFLSLFYRVYFEM